MKTKNTKSNSTMSKKTDKKTDKKPTKQNYAWAVATYPEVELVKVPVGSKVEQPFASALKGKTAIFTTRDKAREFAGICKVFISSIAQGAEIVHFQFDGDDDE